MSGELPSCERRVPLSHRILLWLHPRQFRERSGRDFCQFLELQRREPRYRPVLLGSIRFWRDAATDAVSNAVRIRVSNAHARFRGPFVRRPPDEPKRPLREVISDFVVRDVRFGLRSLRRSPGFTLISVLTLSLGIGATTAIFSVVNHVVLRPLPYPEAQQLVALWMTSVRTDRGSLSYTDFREWRGQNTSFSEVGGYTDVGGVFTAEQGADQLSGIAVSHGLFDLLGVRPLLGRWFTEEEDQIGGPEAIILHRDVWANRYGADSTVIGRTIVVDGDPVTVVGIMPSGFSFPNNDAQFWIPLRGDALLREAGIASPNRGQHFIEAVGRLKRGVSLAIARQDIEAIHARLEEQEPTGRSQGVNLEPLHDVVTGGVRVMLFTFFGAVALVLAVACANVANLYLARATTCGREIAIRTALGAARSRIARQFLIESALVSLLAGAIGMAVAFGLVRILVYIGGTTIPRIAAVGIDMTMLSFAAAVSLLTGLAFGLFPAVQAARQTPVGGIREGARGSTSASDHRLRQALVIAQVAVAVVLLTGGGLLLNSFFRLTSVDPGFAADNMLTARIALPGARYADDEAVLGFFDEIVARVERLPGVQSVATSYSPPLAESDFRITIEIEGHEPASEDDDRLWAGSVLVGHGYFETMGISMLHGRDFTRADRAGPLVAVINETMARRFWPELDPLGKRFRFTGGVRGELESLESRYFNLDWITVIGISEDVRQRDLAEPAIAEFYRPHAHMAWPAAALLVRTTNHPERLVSPLRHEVHALDPSLAVTGINTMRDLVGHSVAAPRFRTVLLVCFAAVAAFLAMIGVYGVMAFAVTQRRREFGIRMALGAETRRVLAEVLRRGVQLTAFGVVLGVLASIAAARFVGSMLYEISSHDPTTYAAIVVSVLLVSITASLVPALRASRVDPMHTLRDE